MKNIILTYTILHCMVYIVLYTFIIGLYIRHSAKAIYTSNAELKKSCYDWFLKTSAKDSEVCLIFSHTLWLWIANAKRPARYVVYDVFKTYGD